MALYFYNYSTWTGVPGIYLEDLFVKENYRKKGYGKRLLKELAGEVLKVGGKRLEWSCLTWNEPSLQFYQSEAVGAQTKDAWVGLRVEGDALGKLARSAIHVNTRLWVRARQSSPNILLLQLHPGQTSSLSVYGPIGLSSNLLGAAMQVGHYA
ncbi:acetyltransferase [Alternaria alternata]|nr:acetyltransferase [Alternaria alternata]